MKVKKITAILLAAGMSLSLYGCKETENSSSESDKQSSATDSQQSENDLTETEKKEIKEYKDLGDGIIMNIADHDITEDEYKYYFYFAKSNIDSGDESYWDDDEEGIKFENLKNQTFEYLFNSCTVYKIASDNSVTLDENDLAKVDKQYEDDVLYYNTVNSGNGKKFEDYLKTIHCSEEAYKEAYVRKELEHKTISALYEEDFIKNHYNDYICTKYILIKPDINYQPDADGNPSETPKNFYEYDDILSYTDKEKEIIEKLNSLAKAADGEGVINAIPELIDVIYERIADGESMDSLMAKYNMDVAAEKNDDGTYTGFYMDHESMPTAFNDIAFALEENEYSSEALYLEGGGYYIIQRIPFDSDYLSALYMGDSQYDYAYDYQEVCSKAMDEVKVIFDTDYDKTVEDLMKSN